MAYPSIEQYQEVLQDTQRAFLDPQLARGRIKTSGSLGTPQVVSGGFALTYAVETDGTKFAVRCFHRPAPELERRYAAVARKLKELSSPYFVNFEFQANGIRANGGIFPIVKMAWAQGVTLGQFVEHNRTNVAKLKNLRKALCQLAQDLERMGIAHGDIQEGNLMVADDGRRVQLIDYDGMFVPELASLGSSELGHRDYQHPQRDKSWYDAKLDRFSFIVLDIALRALCEKPSLWNSTQSGAGVIVLKANDYAAPDVSATLSEVTRIPALQEDIRSFSSICFGGYADIPPLSDFIAGNNLPQQIIISRTPADRSRLIGYISQYPVVDGGNYPVFASHVGDMVELVGRITAVHLSKTRYGKPMAFINLGKYPGCVSLTLWSNALNTPGEKPDESWKGKWISVRGLVQPPSQKQKNPAASIQVENLGQIVQLTQQEAQYRLAGPTTLQVAEPPLSSSAGTEARTTSNTERLAMRRNSAAGLRPATNLPSNSSKPNPPAPPSSRNQQLLDQMRQAAAQRARSAPPTIHSPIPSPPPPPSPPPSPLPPVPSPPRPPAPSWNPQYTPPPWQASSKPAAAGRPASSVPPPAQAPSWGPQYTPIPSPPPRQSTPGWVWLVVAIIGFFILKILFGR